MPEIVNTKGVVGKFHVEHNIIRPGILVLPYWVYLFLTSSVAVNGFHIQFGVSWHMITLCDSGGWSLSLECFYVIKCISVLWYLYVRYLNTWLVYQGVLLLPIKALYMVDTRRSQLCTVKTGLGITGGAAGRVWME